jgi:hypothetical protein
MADKLAVGSKIINSSGTCLEIVNLAEGENLKVGTIPIDWVDEWLEGGYRPVKADEVIPLQAHELPPPARR